jgi:hypothetical protein
MKVTAEKIYNDRCIKIMDRDFMLNRNKAESAGCVAGDIPQKYSRDNVKGT